MSTPTLYDILSKKLEQKRKDHPSFRLMEIDDRLFPNAQTMHSTLVLEARDSNNNLKTVKEIVTESWGKGSKNHLMIEGEGGIGKTVTLLSIPDKFTPSPKPFPSIYIPLHELKGDFNTIEKYIRKRVLSNNEHLYVQLLNLIEQPWDKGPQLLLLLDGFNEIAAENRQTISEDIKYWSEFQGIQIVTSSRYDIHTYVALSYDYSAIKLQPLSNTTVEAYLNSMGVRIPTDSAVKELVTIPLLLTLYVKTELILEQRETDSADFREAKNAGSIVWNYLQCELWHFGKEDKDAKNAIIAMEFIAPYMAWQMQQNSMFILDKKDFHKFLGDAYKMLEDHFNKPDDFPFQIKDVLQKADGIPALETIRNLLEKNLCLFVKNGNSYRLMHQQFRDALAAMHLINSIYLSDNSRPMEWNSTVDHYVMQFVENLISDNEANRLWEQNRKTTPAIEDAIRNQLRLQGLLHDNDFSHLDFSGLDLSKISLYPYRINAKIKIPTLPEKMNNTKLSNKSFSPEGHVGSVYFVAVTQDGKRIVSGSSDSTIRIWDLETGDPIGKPIKRNEYSVNPIALTPDGKRIVCGSDDYKIRVWDLETGDPIGKFTNKTKYYINAIAVTMDGKRIISGSDDYAIRVWDLESSKQIGKPFKGHKHSVTAVAMLPNGKRIISGSRDNTLCVWDLETGKLIGKSFEGHENWINTIAVTPDGKRIISGAGDKTIRVWDVDTGEQIGKPFEGHEDWVYAVTVSPDGKRVISGSGDKTIRMWDIETGCPIGMPIKGHNGRVNTVAVTPDGKRIVSGADDNTIRIWDIETGNPIGTPIEGNKGWVNDIIVTPNRKHIISGSDDNNIRVWDLETNTLIKLLEGHTDSVNAIAVTPDGKRVVSGSKDHTIRIWDLETEELARTLKGHEDWVNAVAVTPNGKYVVSGSWDNTIRIWNLETGKPIKSLFEHEDLVNSIAITPNGKYVISGCSNNTIRIWDLKAGCITKTLYGHNGRVHSIAVTPNGRFIVSGSKDHTIRIWDMESGVTRTIEGHSGWVTSVAITSDGKYIVSGSDDCTIRIWDLETNKLVRLLNGNLNGVEAVTVTPNEKLTVISAGYGYIYIYDIKTSTANSIHILPLSLVGLDFSEAIISTPELKETLRQNGAKVDPD